MYTDAAYHVDRYLYVVLHCHANCDIQIYNFDIDPGWFSQER